MKIVTGSDETGYDLKNALNVYLLDKGHEIADVGTHRSCPVEIAEITQRAIEIFKKKGYDRVLFIDKTGYGMAVAANKTGQVTAAVCSDFESAPETIKKNNCMVMCVDAYMNIMHAQKVVDLWLK